MSYPAAKINRGAVGAYALLAATETMNEKKSEMGAAFAAAIILLAAGFGFFVMPSVVMGLSEISPWLSYAAAAGFVLAFFGVFWLRARYQRRRESGRQ